MPLTKICIQSVEDLCSIALLDALQGGETLDPRGQSREVNRKMCRMCITSVAVKFDSTGAEATAMISASCISSRRETMVSQ